MLLQQLKLHNIRSYREETIIFPEGSILLSGDIGSGKSTILLAIEFALFGTSRSDLPAEALLRKGTSQSSVELSFTLGEQIITIKRALKKEKDQIKQLSGSMIINNLKKELMPIELKAEMISLLGYPEDVLTKNRNYIFRYTIYTPQEEMKFILQEEPELRLDTLRKIFNLDKYKIIRENLQYYLKYSRDSMRIMETRLDPWEGLQQEFQELQNEKGIITYSLQNITIQLNQIKERVQRQQQELEHLEQQQQEYQELLQQQKTLQALSQEKEEQQQQLLKKQKQIQLDFLTLSVPEGLTIEQVEQEKRELEQRKNLILTQTTSLQERAIHLQQLLNQHKEEMNVMVEEISALPLKEQQLEELRKEINQNKNLPQKKIQLEELLIKTSEMITKNDLLLSQSYEILEKITTVETCPLCFQEVSLEHKRQIQKQEQEKIKQAENLLFEFKKKRAQIMEQRTQFEEEQRNIVRKENVLNRLELEIRQLQNKQQQVQQKEEQLQRWKETHGSIQQELEELQGNGLLSLLQQQLVQCQELWHAVMKKQQLGQQLHEVQDQTTKTKEQVRKLEQQLLVVEQQLRRKQDLASEIIDKRNLFSVILQEEKALAIQQAQLQIQRDTLEKQQQKLQQTLAELAHLKQRLIRHQELYHWLEEHFLNLTYSIEKQVMIHVHRLFNQLFQEWFSILIDDETITSRIDDSFTPVIEQNGYEVSFLNLSGGEKTSAALAYRLALNRVINDIIHDIKTKDILILDEPTDGFSSEQLDKVREVLEKLNLRQTIIVSHESKIESFVENVIRVQKEGHVSTIH